MQAARGTEGYLMYAWRDAGHSGAGLGPKRPARELSEVPLAFSLYYQQLFQYRALDSPDLLVCSWLELLESIVLVGVAEPAHDGRQAGEAPRWRKLLSHMVYLLLSEKRIAEELYLVEVRDKIWEALEELRAHTACCLGHSCSPALASYHSCHCFSVWTTQSCVDSHFD